MLGPSQSGAGAWGQCQPRPLGSLTLGEGHVARHPHTQDPLLLQPLTPRLAPGCRGLLTPAGSSLQGTFGRCYQLTEVASGRVYAAKVIPRVRLAMVGIAERVSLGDTQKVPREVGVIPTEIPQSSALDLSPSFPGCWMGSHPRLPKGACRGSPHPEGSLQRGAAGLVPMQVEREQELHGRLCHRHIVRLHGHFADSSHVYLLLEYCSRRVSEHQHPKTEHPHARALPGPPSWHLAPSPVPRRHPAGPGEADGAGGAVLPAADHLGTEIPPRTGHRPPGPQAECVGQSWGGGRVNRTGPAWSHLSLQATSW